MDRDTPHFFFTNKILFSHSKKESMASSDVEESCVYFEDDTSEGSPRVSAETKEEPHKEEIKEAEDTASKQPKSKRPRKSRKSSKADSIHADVGSSPQTDAQSANRANPIPIGVQTALVGLDEIAGGSSENGKKQGKNRKGNRKGEIAVQQFIDTYLPALRKEMSQQRKREQFKLTDYQECFQPNSRVRPTYILPLLHFIGSNSITCTKFGKFDGKCMIKTTDGFNHCMLLNKFSSANNIKEEELSFIMKRFGKEWHKIPAKDEVRVSMAIRAGHMGQFKITLSGVYEDSFFNNEGEEILTLNPILNYEGIRIKETAAPCEGTSCSSTSEPSKKRKERPKPALDPHDVLSGPMHPL